MSPAALSRNFVFRYCWIFAIVLFHPAVPAFAAAADQEPVRIASIFALTGPAAESNLPSVRGVRWAVQEINERGGVSGRRLELIELDNLGTAIGSKVAADKAVAAGVAAIIGPAWSTHALAAARVAQANRVPMIANISTHPGVTRIGDYIFRVCYTDRIQGRVIARFARLDLKLKTAVILQNITSDFSLILSGIFGGTFEALGGRVVGRLPYKSDSDFDDLAARTKALGAQAVFIPGYDESGLIVAAAERIGMRAVFLGADGWDAEVFFRRGGDRMSIGYYTTHWDEAIQTPETRAFVARYGNPRSTIVAPAALGYDAVMLFEDAVRRAGSTQHQAVRDALAATDHFHGVTGKLSFDGQGDPVKNVVIIRIDSGRPFFLKEVGPEQAPASQ